MAVYTQVTDKALSDFLADYDIGEAISFKGIAEGVENSNYYLETTAGRFILTLFEKRADPKDLPYFIALKQHLSAKGFACPQPVNDTHGNALKTLEGRPAVIVTFLTGLSPRVPNARQCRALGAALAELHLAAADFPRRRENTLGPSAWPQLWLGRNADAEALLSGLPELISQDLEAIRTANLSKLDIPLGTIHADLFPDNTFFLGDAFRGAIDFYFACSGPLAYDLAICINAWVFERDGEYNFSKSTNLIAGYQSIRPLSEIEKQALPILCRGAAIRFFLTRLIDWVETPKDALVKPHDPLDYAKRLIFHRRAERPEDYGV